MSEVALALMDLRSRFAEGVPADLAFPDVAAEHGLKERTLRAFWQQASMAKHPGQTALAV